MNRKELEILWSETLRSEKPTESQFDTLTNAVVEVYSSGDIQFRQHIRNRFNRVSESTGVQLDPENFKAETARAFIADEIGFTSWDDLIDALSDQDQKPVLFQYAVAAMERGDFSALESAIGPDRFHGQIVTWFENDIFQGEQETLDEIFSAACMLGHVETAEYLLDRGIDPYAGMKTGLSGFHYAASSGRLEVIKLLIERNVPMEVKNMYGGTVFEQAIWSAVNEYTPDHAAIVEALVKAGAIVEDGYAEWWNKQNVPDAATKERVAEVLKRHHEFHQRISLAEQAVAGAEQSSNKRALADALKQLGNILRRPRFTRDAANEAYSRAANIYREIGLPLEEAWVKRHIGINHEYAERLTEAEKYYDESLALFRQHASDDDDNYANTVRYPAVIKNRVGKRDESTALWEEAVRRYDEMGQPLGVAEGAAWLTIVAIEKGETALAHEWFAKAEAAASSAHDPDTDKWIAEVRGKLDDAG
jgi:tetratricopeptide (TPR) repeat protein